MALWSGRAPSTPEEDFVFHRIKRLAPFVVGLAFVATVVTLFAVAQSGAAEVHLGESDTYGPHLVDGDGMSLYLFLRDEDGDSACYDQCAEAWPPLFGHGDTVSGEGIYAELLATTERNDGRLQVTYAGWPLYYFAADGEAGDTNGQGVNDVWFLIGPDGDPIDDASTVVYGYEDDVADDDIAGLLAEGEAVYTSHCVSCHGAAGNLDGGGATILVGNRALANGQRVSMQVMFGGQYMPAFGSVLDDRQVAASVTYIRNSWGNDFGVITEEEVREIRERVR